MVTRKTGAEPQTAVLVREIMRRDVATARPDQSVADVARELRDQNLTGMPVLDEQGALVGVVTEYDIVSKRGATVGDIMSRGVITATEETSAERLVELVGLHGIRGIPVLRDGAFVGLVTRADLVALYLAIAWTCAACGHQERGITPPGACPACGQQAWRLDRAEA